MNTPPIFKLCNNCPAVVNLLKDNGVLRVFEFGQAPQDVAKPYVVWQEISGGHEPSLDLRPCNENHFIQVDCYAETASEAKDIKNVIELALETHALTTTYRGNSKESETKLFRTTLDFEFLTTRQNYG